MPRTTTTAHRALHVVIDELGDDAIEIGSPLVGGSCFVHYTGAHDGRPGAQRAVAEVLDAGRGVGVGVVGMAPR